jgi:predicted nuclease of predicted toxin-antitoxin system
MKKYLVDVNLPYYFSLWNKEEFIHQKDINDEWTDGQIWNYARKNNLTIITKDSDFSHRIILHNPPPRVIHIRFGNLKMKEFFYILSSHWNDIQEMSNKSKLVNVFEDRIEAIE